MVNTTHQAMLRNLTVTNNVNIKEESIMSSRRYFMHMVGALRCVKPLQFLFPFVVWMKLVPILYVMIDISLTILFVRPQAVVRVLLM